MSSSICLDNVDVTEHEVEEEDDPHHEEESGHQTCGHPVKLLEAQ